MTERQTLENLGHKGRKALQYLETDTALQIFKDVLEIDEDFLDAWVGLGQTYYEMGKLKEAEAAYHKAEKLVYKEFGSTWKKKKLAWQTEKHRPALRLVHGLGILMFRRGDNQDAKKWFELEHTLDPSLEAPLVMLADIEAGRKFNKLKFQHLDI